MDLALALPLVVLILKTGMKLWVDRTGTAEAVIKAVIALPVDLVFLSFTYTVARLAMLPDNTMPQSNAMWLVFWTIVYIILCGALVLICKHADNFQSAKKYGRFFLLFLVSYLLAAFPTVFVLTM